MRRVGIELVLFLTPGIDQSEQEQGELLQPQFETTKMANLNQDDILKLIQLQAAFLLLRTFFFFFLTL